MKRFLSALHESSSGSELPEQLNQLSQAILGEDAPKLSPRRLLAKVEELKRLHLPNGSEALLKAMSDQCIAEEITSRRRKGIGMGVMEGLTDRRNTPLPISKADDAETVELTRSLLSGRGHDVVGATSVLLEHADRQATGVDRAALLTFMVRRLHETMESDQFTKRKVISWEAPGTRAPQVSQLEALLEFAKEEVAYWARRGCEVLLGKNDTKPPYLEPLSSVLYKERRLAEADATREYLGVSRDLDDFADRYSTLLFSNCADEHLDWKLTKALREIFKKDDPEFGSLNRIRAELTQWTSEDIHCMVRRLAGDHYPELKPAHKERIFLAIKDLL